MLMRSMFQRCNLWNKKPQVPSSAVEDLDVLHHGAGPVSPVVVDGGGQGAVGKLHGGLHDALHHLVGLNWQEKELLQPKKCCRQIFFSLSEKGSGGLLQRYALNR